MVIVLRLILSGFKLGLKEFKLGPAMKVLAMVDLDRYLLIVINLSTVR